MNFPLSTASLLEPERPLDSVMRGRPAASPASKCRAVLTPVRRQLLSKEGVA
jgi:hypothetical protein